MSPNARRMWMIGVLFAATLQPMTGLAAEQTDFEFFEKRIRPVLAEQCYPCHSTQSRKSKGSLLLDSRSGIRTGGESGPAVVVGNVDDSLIISALRHDSFEMPPGKKLPDSVIADFVRWIGLGASDPRDEPDRPPGFVDVSETARTHWAFQPMRRPTPPTVTHADQVSSPLDQFILSRLEEQGLTLSPQADRRTLVRRAFLDLWGLPPAPEEVEEFLNDAAPDAFSRLVDRLLDSPHYGERWGRYWLDIARYADNKGYVFFEEKRFPWAWTYRDYVIRSLNDDLPFDRFVVEQLAADQLELGDDRRPLTAMGFLTLGPRFMNNAHDILDDRIDVVTRGLMGLTVTCARCHDHKFDPIPQADYYALYGVFRSSVEPMLPPEFEPGDDSEAYRDFKTGMQERLDKLDTFIQTQRSDIMHGARTRAAEYLLAVHNKRDKPDTENFMLLTDKGGLNPAIIHRWEIYLRRAVRAADPVWTVWETFSELPTDGFADAAAKVHAHLFDGSNPKTGPVDIHPLVRAVFVESPPTSMQQVAERYGQLLAEIDDQWQSRLSEATKEGNELPTALADTSAETLRQVLYGSQSPAMIPRELSWGFLDLLPDRPTQAEFQKLLKEVETWSMNQPGAPPRAMVLQDAESPFDPVIFLRGNPNREGQSVSRHFLEILAGPEPPTFQHGSGRLELARKIVDPTNPLTARVFVNRVWQHHFGQALVETPSDFGLRSDPPSHPELLDWLATSFIDNGWSMKQLHRTIMNSAAYQQSSEPAAPQAETDGLQADPENRLLWRFRRRRLDFEAMRDSLLAVSGDLERTTGGPALEVLSTFTPRRTIYGFIDRMDLPGLMRAFDFPDPAATSPQRQRTTVAPQALFLMNHDFPNECARRLLKRDDIAALQEVDARIERIYRILFSRAPDPAERELARAYLAQSADTPQKSAWQYGYGKIDESEQRVVGFAELKHWTGTRWQAGPQLPDPELGWVFVDREGGHPAATLDRCVIRRWTADFAGRVEITGTLLHAVDQGNGVRGRIVSSRQGVLGEWKVHNSQAEVEKIAATVEPGDTLDFVVDFNGQITHDEHQWPVVIRAMASPTTDRDATDPRAGQSNESKAFKTWDSRQEFRGEQPDPWVDYVQALMMTNEFVFID